MHETNFGQKLRVEINVEMYFLPSIISKKKYEGKIKKGWPPIAILDNDA